MARPRRNRIPNYNPGKGRTRIAAVKALSSPDSRQQTGVGRVSRWGTEKMGKSTKPATGFMSALLRRFARVDDGATAIEYALIASGIGLAIVVAVQAIGPALNDQYVSFDNFF